MGHSSKKKKRGGTGRRRAPSKAIDGVGGELLSEELTALSAIFQEDCDVVSESPPRIKIKLRPYSQDSGYEDVDVSALLSIRHDVVSLCNLCNNQLSRKNVAVSCARPSKGPFVYSFTNLFIGSGESWHWGLSVEDNNSTSTSLQIHALDDLHHGSNASLEKVNQNMKMGVVEDGKPDKVLSPATRLHTLEEESRSTDSFTPLSEESEENVSIGEFFEMPRHEAIKPLVYIEEPANRLMQPCLQPRM